MRPPTISPSVSISISAAISTSISASTSRWRARVGLSIGAALLAIACGPSGGLEVDPSPPDLFASSSGGALTDGGEGSTSDAPSPPGPPSLTTSAGSGGGESEGDSGGGDSALLIPAQARWRYAVVDPGGAWAAIDHDDAAWSEGQAPIGGGGAESLTTVIDSTAAPIAARLRHRFTLAEAPSGGLLLLHLRRADGAAVLINGAPALQTNLAGQAGAEASASGDEGRRYLRFVVAADALVVGDNVVAVELHRSAATSPFALDLQLERLPPADGVYVQLRTRPYGGEYSDANVGAIWVERPGGEFVRTLAVWAASRREHLVRWRAASASDTVDAITSATRGSHRSTALTWDLKDALGGVAAPGEYLLRAEFTEENSNKGDPLGPLLEVPFVVGAGTAVTIPGSGGFRDVTLIAP